MREVPEKIYLQAVGEDVDSDPDAPIPWNSGDITWCADKIFDTDIEYVLAPRERRKYMVKHHGKPLPPRKPQPKKPPKF